MPQIILSATDDESEILGDEIRGLFQMVCIKYGTAEVVLEVRDPETDETDFPWVTARYKGEDIEFTAVGDSFDVFLTRGFDYRLKTGTAGAVVSMDRHESW